MDALYEFWYVSYAHEEGHQEFSGTFLFAVIIFYKDEFSVLQGLVSDILTH